jgi:hypothetical protein
VVEGVNGDMTALLRRWSRYKSLRYLLLKVRPLTELNTEFLIPRKAAEMRGFLHSRSEP